MNILGLIRLFLTLVISVPLCLLHSASSSLVSDKKEICGPLFPFIPLLSPPCHSPWAWEWVLICSVCVRACVCGWGVWAPTHTDINTHGNSITSRDVWEMGHRDTIQASRNTLIVKRDEACNINQSIIKHHFRLPLTLLRSCTEIYTRLLNGPEVGLCKG